MKLSEIRECKTPEELALLIWDLKFEKLTGRSKQSYRTGLINWIKKFAGKTNEKLIWKSYVTPRDLANGIWTPMIYRTENDKAIRDEFVNWIFNYVKVSEGENL